MELRMDGRKALITGASLGLGRAMAERFAGAGAEMRGMPTVYPDGYGLRRFNAKGWCGGNLHFIRTDDLATNWTGLNDPKGDHGAAVKPHANGDLSRSRGPYQGFATMRGESPRAC